MKFLILMMLSLTAYAETYEVNHRGHVYTFQDDDKGLSLTSKRLAFEIPVKPCSKNLIEGVKANFTSKFKVLTASTQDVVTVKSSNKTVQVPAGHNNGKYLIYFPDHFAKSFLVYKELCKK
jgi:hypothetical protein